MLAIGAILALVWANTDAASYHHFVDLVIWDNAPLGHLHNGHRTLTLQFLINDVFMALFFAIAGKEVWEAVILRNGSLRGKRAATPLFATAGGILGPVAVYLGLAGLTGSGTYDALANGWAIPTATDIAFSYMVGRAVFGAGHPAVRFLLLIAIADDAAGLIILALFYPSGDMAPEWLLVSLAAAVIVYALFNALPRRMDRDRRNQPAATWARKRLHLAPYAIAGMISWYAFMRAGLHPALGLLPIVPAIPHSDSGFGLNSQAKPHLTDLLNQLEHRLKRPVDFVLFGFGLLNAGVEVTAIGAATWPVLGGLLIGKPLGISVFGWIAAVPLGLGLPHGMRLSDLAVIGCVAAIGFTVSLFVASVAFAPGAIQDAAKMGAFLSFAAVFVSLIAAKVFRVQKRS